MQNRLQTQSCNVTDALYLEPLLSVVMIAQVFNLNLSAETYDYYYFRPLTFSPAKVKYALNAKAHPAHSKKYIDSV